MGLSGYDPPPLPNRSTLLGKGGGRTMEIRSRGNEMRVVLKNESGETERGTFNQSHHLNKSYRSNRLLEIVMNR